MWHPWVTPDDNFLVISVIQRLLGYARYLFITPIFFDLFWSSVRYSMYDEEWGELYHRWVYYVGGVYFVFFCWMVILLVYDAILPSLEGIQASIAGFTTLFIFWILVDLMFD